MAPQKTAGASKQYIHLIVSGERTFPAYKLVSEQLGDVVMNSAMKLTCDPIKSSESANRALSFIEWARKRFRKDQKGIVFGYRMINP